MPIWYVRLEFERGPDFGSPSEAEWKKLHALAGEFVDYTGQGTPMEFRSSVTVEAESPDEAKEKALDDIVSQLNDEGLEGWGVTAHEAQAPPDEDESGKGSGRRGARSRGGRKPRAKRSRGYDPGAPPRKR